MLVEIPDMVFSLVAAFLVGLFGLYAYYKLRPYIGSGQAGAEPGQQERLEYYERQLIDMKIRLDALELVGLGENTPQTRPEPPVTKPPKTEVIKDVPAQAQRLPNMASNNAVDHVLRLIIDNDMTSRDIQITLGRSREHTSRLMKKLFEGGYVHRNSKAKPYTYSITDRGKKKISVVGGPAVVG